LKPGKKNSCALMKKEGRGGSRCHDGRPGVRGKKFEVEGRSEPRREVTNHRKSKRIPEASQAKERKNVQRLLGRSLECENKLKNGGKFNVQHRPLRTNWDVQLYNPFHRIGSGWRRNPEHFGNRGGQQLNKNTLVV